MKSFGTRMFQTTLVGHLDFVAVVIIARLKSTLTLFVLALHILSLSFIRVGSILYYGDP